MRTRLVATTAAGLLAGGLAGAWLGVPAVSSAQDATTTSDDAAEEAVGPRHSRIGPLEQALDGLVEDDTITEDQADAVLEAVREQYQRHPRLGKVLGTHLDVAAEVLGLESADLVSRLRDGATLAELAEEQGVDADALVDALVAALEARIDEAVAEGSIDEERAAALTEGAQERVTRLVEEGLDPRRPGPRPFGHRR